MIYFFNNFFINQSQEWSCLTPPGYTFGDDFHSREMKILIKWFYIRKKIEQHDTKQSLTL